MDNLINFDEVIDNKKIQRSKSPIPFAYPLLVPEKLTNDINNPFDRLEQCLAYPDDPFESIETQAQLKIKIDPNEELHLQDGSLFSFDCFSMDSSQLSSSSNKNQSTKNSSLNSELSHKTVNRSQSDSSSTGNSKLCHEKLIKNNSADSIQKKSQPLLRLSFYNSPNSPLKCSSFNNNSDADNISVEAKKIAKKFALSKELSNEDINNISSQLVDISLNDSDFQDLNLKVLDNKNSTVVPSPPSADKIAKLQMQLQRIKKEADNEVPVPVKIKQEKLSPIKHEDKIKEEEIDNKEFEGILQNLRNVMSLGNKDEAKKHLNRLNELIGKDEKPSNEAKNTLHVQPIVRQDTFEIDADTGNRSYKNSTTPQKNGSEEIVKKLSEILGSSAVEVHSLDLGKHAMNQTKLVVVMPTSTPMKKPQRPSMSMSTSKVPTSAIKALEKKRPLTPMRNSLTSDRLKRLSSATAPRPVTNSNPYAQKLGVGTVRKSLMGSMEKSPHNLKSSIDGSRKTMTGTPRRSVSMKASIPQVSVSKPSPTKSSNFRPSTSAGVNSTTNKRTSIASFDKKRPSTVTASKPSSLSKQNFSKFKTPSAVRKVPKNDDGSLV
ncbi:CLUMA_CG017894, isoform A [Clunio marinus]|uniref:CLUMA_CG017894, isoform A n=1 Tax=Clunio marinus TaxID=568069 RepID=A0A1J1J1W1_9DIPT|nr:CLUMA_CG017894, isoform A [Clunio marinus]